MICGCYLEERVSRVCAQRGCDTIDKAQRGSCDANVLCHRLASFSSSGYKNMMILKEIGEKLRCRQFF